MADGTVDRLVMTGVAIGSGMGLRASPDGCLCFAGIAPVAGTAA